MEPGDGGTQRPTGCCPVPSRAAVAPGDLRDDAALPQTTKVAVEVVAALGIQFPRLAPGAPALASHWRQFVDQRQGLGDVVAVSAGRRHAQRDAVRIGQYVVLRVRPCTVNRAFDGPMGCFAPARPAPASRRRLRGRSQAVRFPLPVALGPASTGAVWRLSESARQLDANVVRMSPDQRVERRRTGTWTFSWWSWPGTARWSPPTDRAPRAKGASPGSPTAPHAAWPRASGACRT